MFADTNVLIFSRVSQTPNHHLARAMLQRALQGPEPVRISRQVIREYLSGITRPTWEGHITPEDALNDVVAMLDTYEVLEDGPVVTDTLIALCREVVVNSRQVHDANIVATMLAHGERRLMTFNAPDFRRYGDRIELIES